MTIKLRHYRFCLFVLFAKAEFISLPWRPLNLQVSLLKDNQVENLDMLRYKPGQT